MQIDIFIQKYHSLQISVTPENKMAMKLELIVEVAVLRVVVSIIVIMYVNLVFKWHYNILSFTNFNVFQITVWVPMLDEVNNMLVCSNADLHLEKELDLLTCKDEARRLDFKFIRHSNLITDATNGTELNYNSTETNTTKTNTTRNSIQDLCQIYRSCQETIPSKEGNTYQYSSKFYVSLSDPRSH